MKIDKDKVIVSFADKNGGLVAKDKYGYLRGFEVAGSDRRFHWAMARIEGDKVIVSSKKCFESRCSAIRLVKCYR